MLFSLFLNFADTNPQVERSKKGVVCIEIRTVMASEDRGNFYGTGFVISKDKEGNVYAITNSHVARGEGMTSLELITVEGDKQIEAYHLFTHPLLDMAILKIKKEDAAKVLGTLEAIPISESLPQVGDKVHVIGYPDRNSFTADTGVVSNINECMVGYFPGRFIRITVTSVGGYSGGPVLNEKGEAVAIIFAGSRTSLWSIPLSYITEIIEKVKKGTIPSVAFAGFYLDMMALDDAVKKYKLPCEVAQAYAQTYPDSFRRIPFVSSMPQQYGKANGIVEPGDILMAVNDQEIGPDLVRMAKIMDEALEKKGQAKLTVYRDGKKIHLNLPLEKAFFPHRILRFAGAIFSESDMSRARVLGIPPRTPLLTQIEPGTLFFGEISPIWNQDKYALLIHEINGRKIKTFDELVEAIQHVRQKENELLMKCSNIGVYPWYNEEFMLARDCVSIALSLRTPNDRTLQLYRRVSQADGDRWEILDGKLP